MSDVRSRATKDVALAKGNAENFAPDWLASGSRNMAAQRDRIA